MIHVGNGRASTKSTSARVREGSAGVYHEKSEWQQTLEDWIGDHPLASLAAAVCLGAALGWVIKRR